MVVVAVVVVVRRVVVVAGCRRLARSRMRALAFIATRGRIEHLDRGAPHAAARDGITRVPRLHVPARPAREGRTDRSRALRDREQTEDAEPRRRATRDPQLP